MRAGPITVVQMLPDLEGGGVERGTLELGNFLCIGGHRSIVISAGGRMVTQLENEGSRHITWKTGVKSPVSLRYILPLRRLLQEEKADILHLRSRFPAWIGYLAWKSLPVDSRPHLVTTFHGFYSVNAYSRIMTRGERTIAISHTIAAHIKEAYGVPDERIVVIYRGFDEKTFNPETVGQDRIERLRKKWRLEDVKGPMIMLPGRLTRLKGHDLFLKALARNRSLQWAAVCVGDSDENRPYVDELESLQRELGLEDRVRFAGHCDDMPAALMLSDIVVSATTARPEAFGRIAVEAQAMGKPVIASAHGGSLETVLNGESGYLVKAGDVQQLAEALKKMILDNALRAAFGRNGRQWVKKKFTTDMMCQKTVSLYRDLLV